MNVCTKCVCVSDYVRLVFLSTVTDSRQYAETAGQIKRNRHFQNVTQKFSFIEQYNGCLNSAQ